MKIFIVKSESDYKIYKVSDPLVEEFKEAKQENIVIEASSIQDALVQFSQLDKDCDLSFNSELTRVKEEHIRIQKSKETSTNKSSRIKIT